MDVFTEGELRNWRECAPKPARPITDTDRLNWLESVMLHYPTVHGVLRTPDGVRAAIDAAMRGPNPADEPRASKTTDSKSP